MWPLLKATGMTCRDAFRMCSERMDQPLNRADAIRLRLHLLMCGLCRRLPIQLENLRGLLRCCHHEETSGPEGFEPLSHEARERIEKHLHQQSR